MGCLFYVIMWVPVGLSPYTQGMTVHTRDNLDEDIRTIQCSSTINIVKYDQGCHGPSLHLNGHQWYSRLTLKSIMHIIEFEVERYKKTVTGRLCKLQQKATGQH